MLIVEKYDWTYTADQRAGQDLFDIFRESTRDVIAKAVHLVRRTLARRR